jgi:hypothetical protein
VIRSDATSSNQISLYGLIFSLRKPSVDVDTVGWKHFRRGAA